MTQNTQTITELSVDTQAIERLLLTAGVNDIVTYAALTAAIGRDVQGNARSNLIAAVRRVLRDHDIVFDAVHNVGVKRLDDAAIVGLGHRYTRKIGRMARRARRKLSKVQDFAALPNALRVEHNLRYAMLSVVGYFAGEKQAKRLAGRIQETMPGVTLRASLDAMKDDL